MTRTAREQRMDDLATRIGEACEGETLSDTMTACAAVIAYGLLEIKPEKRADVLATLLIFLNELVENGKVRS